MIEKKLNNKSIKLGNIITDNTNMPDLGHV